MSLSQAFPKSNGRAFFVKRIDYYDYCRQIRSLKETKEINKSLKFLLLDFADRHGYDGMICPSNETLAEANCISVKSINGLLSRARKNKLIKTSPARKGKPRYITLLCPETGEPIFLRICKKDSNNLANVQKSLDSTYYIKDKEKIKESPLPIEYQINALRYKVPKDVRYEVGCTVTLKTGIDIIGFDRLSILLADMRTESHIDFFEALENRIRDIGYQNLSQLQ